MTLCYYMRKTFFTMMNFWLRSSLRIKGLLIWFGILTRIRLFFNWKLRKKNAAWLFIINQTEDGCLKISLNKKAKSFWWNSLKEIFLLFFKVESFNRFNSMKIFKLLIMNSITRIAKVFRSLLRIKDFL